MNQILNQIYMLILCYFHFMLLEFWIMIMFSDE